MIKCKHVQIIKLDNQIVKLSVQTLGVAAVLKSKKKKKSGNELRWILKHR